MVSQRRTFLLLSSFSYFRYLQCCKSIRFTLIVVQVNAVSVYKMFRYAACPGNMITHVPLCFVHGNCHSLQMNRADSLWWRVLKLILFEFARIFNWFLCVSVV